MYFTGKNMLSSKLFNKSSYLCKCFKYSTAASPVIEDPLARFRTFEERPVSIPLNTFGLMVIPVAHKIANTKNAV